jgi:hypothetical protein
MDSTYSNLQASCLMGRPKSVVQFAIRYLSDEKVTFQFPVHFNYTMPSNVYLQIIEEYHAIQLLPFLITQPEEFRNIACVIFSTEQMHGHFAQDLHQYASNNTSQAVAMTARQSVLGSVSTDSAKDRASGKQSQFSPNYREFLDGSTLLDIIQAMDLPSHGLQQNYIDEVRVYSLIILISQLIFFYFFPRFPQLITDKLEPLKKIDFNLFISAIRFPLALYQSVNWLKDEIYSFLKTQQDILVDLSQLFPVSDELNLDTGRLKSFLNK